MHIQRTEGGSKRSPDVNFGGYENSSSFALVEAQRLQELCRKSSHSIIEVRKIFLEIFILQATANCICNILCKLQNMFTLVFLFDFGLI